MSTNIDERVVKMEFDDSGFSAGAEKAIGVLDKLKDSLNLDGATSGLSSVQKAANSLNMDGISNAVETAGNRFNWLQEVGIGAMRNLGARVENFAHTVPKQIFNALTKGAKDGFDEYDMQMGSIQTILSNTRDAFTQSGISNEADMIDIINDRLNVLNKYADDTIYNFSQMTRNIGLFTAAGVDLDTSVTAIKGLSNLAAVSGADTNAASRAMYQMSQAMSTGVVKLMDWNSLVNAGMGGKLFQDEILRVARNQGIAVDSMISKNGSFRESLKEGWLTTEVFNEALQHLTYNYEEEGDAAWEAGIAELRAAGYSQENAEAIMKLGKAATEAATKVRTWKQLWDTVSEAIGSGWAQTWQIVVGDFLEATELFTWFSEKIGGLVQASADARNGVLQAWADAGGRGALVDTLKNLYEMVEKPLLAIGRAFSRVFGISAEQLWNITTAIAAFTKSLVMSDDVALMFEFVMTDIFTVMHSILGVLGNVTRVIVGIGEIIWQILTPAFEAAAIAFALIMDPIAKFSTVILAITDIIQHFVQNGLNELGKKIETVFGAIGEFLGGIYKKMEPALKLMDSLFTKMGHTAKAFYGAIMEDKGFGAFGKAAADAAYMLTIFRGELEKAGPIANGFIPIVDALHDVFASIRDHFKELAEDGSGTVTPFIESVGPQFQKLGQTIYEALPAPLKGVADFLKNSFVQIRDSIVDFVSKSELIQSAVGAFKNLRESIVGVFSGDLSIGDSFFNFIDTLKNGAIDVFWKLPKPIQLVVGGIGLLAKTLYDNAKKFITGTFLFRNLKKVFEDFSSGKETLTFMNVLTRVKDAIKESFKHMVDVLQNSPIGGVFKTILNKFKDFGDGLIANVPQLSLISQFFKDAFSSDDVFGAFSEKITEIFSNLPETFQSLFEAIGRTFEYLKDNVTTEAGKLDFSNLKDTLSGLTSLPDLLSPVSDGVGDVSVSLQTGMDGILNAINPEKLEQYGVLAKGILDTGLIISFTNFINSLKKVNLSIASIGTSIANWPKEMGNMFSRIGEGFHKETKMDQLVKLASAIAILAGSLFLIASIPAEDLKRASKTIALITGAMLGIIAMMDAVSKKFTGMFDASRMTALGVTMQGMGIGVLAFAAACWVIAKLPTDEFDTAIGKITAIAIMLAALSAAIGANGKSVKKGSIGMILMAGAVYAMGKAIEAIGGLDQDALDNGVSYFIAIMTMMTLFGKFGGEGISKLLGSFMKFGIGLVALGLGLGVIAKAMEVLNESISSIDNLKVVLGVMIGSIVAFVLFSKIMEKSDPLKTATSLVVFASAIAAMAGAFAIMGQFGGDWQSILAATAAFGALIGAFAGIAALGQKLDAGALMKTATSLVVFASAIAVMAAGIGGMMWLINTDMQSFGNAIFVIIGFFAAFAAMGTLLDPASVMTISQAMVVFAASIVVFAAGVFALSQVDVMAAVPGLIAFVAGMVAIGVAAALLGPAAVAMIWVAQAMLIFGAAVTLFAAGIWILVQAIKDLEGLDPETIITRLAALGTGIGEMAWGMITSFFSNLATAVTEELPTIIENIGNLFSSIAAWITENWPTIIEAINGFFESAGEFFGNVLTWLAENLPGIFTSIVTFIGDHLPEIMTAGGEIVDTLINALGPMVEGAWNTAQEAIGNLVDYLSSPEGQQEVMDRASELGQMILDGLGMVVEGIGDVVGRIIDGIGNWISDRLNDMTDSGSEIGDNIIQGVIDGATALLSSIGELATTIGDTILTGIKDFLGIHSPSTEMMDVGENVVQGLIDGIGDFLGNLGEKAVELGSTILDNVTSLPGTLLQKGGEVVGGLIDGIGSGVGNLAKGAANLATTVVGGVRDLGSNLKGKGTEASSNLSAGLDSGVVKANAVMNKMIVNMSNIMTKMVSDMKKSGTEAMSQFANGLSGASDKVKKALNSLVQATNGYANSMYSAFHYIGKQAVNGLIDGIDSRLDSAKKKVDQLGNTVAKAAKLSLQIKSPSRVFKRIGKYVVEGLVVGIDQNLKSAENAGEDLANTIPNSFIDTLSAMSVDMEDILATDYNPVITPVINSAEFDSSMDRLANMMNGRLSGVSIGDINYNETFAGKLDDLADVNRQAMQEFASNAIDYNLLGASVANALIRSGVHVEMDGGQLMGYLAGQIRDVRRMYG